MTSAQNNEISKKSDNSTDNKKSKKKISKNKPKKSHIFTYLYLFAFVFVVALMSLSYLIKSYSPEIDVTIGNNDSFTLNDSDVDMEIKTIDERLKWIQMEDDLPSVSVRGLDKQEKNQMKVEKNKQEKDEKDEKDTLKKAKEIPPKPPAPEIYSAHNSQDLKFNDIPTKDVINSRKTATKPRTITKVYLGNYKTLDDAMEVQNKIKAIDSSISPFVKSVKGHYIVQLGSFSDSEKAGILAEKLTEKGYYPKINYEN